MDYIGDNKLQLSNVISNIEHHYKDNSSAANSIKSMIKIGVIKLKLVKESGKIWVKVGNGNSMTPNENLTSLTIIIQSLKCRA